MTGGLAGTPGLPEAAPEARHLPLTRGERTLCGTAHLALVLRAERADGGDPLVKLPGVGTGDPLPAVPGLLWLERKDAPVYFLLSVVGLFVFEGAGQGGQRAERKGAAGWSGNSAKWLGHRLQCCLGQQVLCVSFQPPANSVHTRRPWGMVCGLCVLCEVWSVVCVVCV